MFKLQCYQGIGDHFYQRPFVRELLKIHGNLAVATAFPELFHDMPGIKFWYRQTMLVGQFKAAQKVDKSKWEGVHKNAAPDLHIGYGHREFYDGLNIVQAYEKIVQLSVPYDMTFPLKDEWVEKAKKVIGNKKVCILRQPTFRREYPNPARNPEKGLMQHLVDTLKQRDYYIISVGDLINGHESLVEDIKGVNEKYHEGEFEIWEIAALIKYAALTLTTVGYAVPMSCAVQGACFTVFGGHVSPSLIYDDRMGLDRHHFIASEPFCNCIDMSHDCKKDIPYDRAQAELLRFIEMGCRSGNGVLAGR